MTRFFKVRQKLIFLFIVFIYGLYLIYRLYRRCRRCFRDGALPVCCDRAWKLILVVRLTFVTLINVAPFVPPGSTFGGNGKLKLLGEVKEVRHGCNLHASGEPLTLLGDKECRTV